ncbi:DUF3096 domain-containing protein [Candidatus Woesearchaeota archaeon]|nr:DUF3096 domain-containing protein [Candidatus Woesearchaeota archaeon]
MLKIGFLKGGLNYFFILCIILGIVILAVPNILEFVIAIFLLIVGASGLLSGMGGRKRFF